MLILSLCHWFIGDYNVKADAAAVCHKETSETAIYLSPDNLNLNSFRMIASSTCHGIPDGPRAEENVHLRWNEAQPTHKKTNPRKKIPTSGKATEPLRCGQRKQWRCGRIFVARSLLPPRRKGRAEVENPFGSGFSFDATVFYVICMFCFPNRGSTFLLPVPCWNPTDGPTGGHKIFHPF